MQAETADALVVVEDTQAWVMKAVIGLGLCPFANAVHVKLHVIVAEKHASTAQQLHGTVQGKNTQKHQTGGEKTAATRGIKPTFLARIYR